MVHKIMVSSYTLWYIKIVVTGSEIFLNHLEWYNLEVHSMLKNLLFGLQKLPINFSERRKDLFPFGTKMCQSAQAHN